MSLATLFGYIIPCETIFRRESESIKITIKRIHYNLHLCSVSNPLKNRGIENWSNFLSPNVSQLHRALTVAVFWTEVRKSCFYLKCPQCTLKTFCISSTLNLVL